MIRYLLLILTVSSTAFAEVDCDTAFDPNNKITFQTEATWYFNSSNSEKLKHLDSTLRRHNIQTLNHDLAEIKADHFKVVVHKASQFNDPNKRVVVEDTSLIVSSTDIREDIRWRIDELEHHHGRRAIWVSMMAYRVGDTVYVFHRFIRGFISYKRPGLEGIEAYFKPENLADTYTPPSVMAFQDVIQGKVYKTAPAMDSWQGEWQ